MLQQQRIGRRQLVAIKEAAKVVCHRRLHQPELALEREQLVRQRTRIVGRQIVRKLEFDMLVSNADALALAELLVRHAEQRHGRRLPRDQQLLHRRRVAEQFLDHDRRAKVRLASDAERRRRQSLLLHQQPQRLEIRWTHVDRKLGCLEAGERVPNRLPERRVLVAQALERRALGLAGAHFANQRHARREARHVARRARRTQAQLGRDVEVRILEERRRKVVADQCRQQRQQVLAHAEQFAHHAVVVILAADDGVAAGGRVLADLLELRHHELDARDRNVEDVRKDAKVTVEAEHEGLQRRGVASQREVGLAHAHDHLALQLAKDALRLRHDHGRMQRALGRTRRRPRCTGVRRASSTAAMRERRRVSEAVAAIDRVHDEFDLLLLATAESRLLVARELGARAGRVKVEHRADRRAQ